jgi:hypothetical protein
VTQAISGEAISAVASAINADGAHADRVDVVQIGAAELDAGRTQAQRLVDDQVGDDGGDPGNGDVRVQSQHLVQRLEDVQLHQQHGDQRVEDGPDHAARMAVRQARKKIRPRQRAGISVGHIDFYLRDDDEQRRGGQRQGGIVEYLLEAGQVHARGIDRLQQRHGLADGQVSQQRAAQHLRDAGQYPAGAGGQHAKVPAQAVFPGLLGHEAQEVDLLADLRDQRHADRRGGAEHQHIEMAVVSRAAGEVQQLPRQFGAAQQDGDKGEREQQQPARLGDHLDAADQRHAVGHQRDDDQRADQVAEIERQAAIQLQRVGHDGRLQREQDERERGVDEGGNGRADITETGAAREQVHVDAVAGGVVADRQAAEKDDQAHRHDGPEGVDKAVVDGDGAADRLQHEEGNGAEGRAGDAKHRPLPERTRCVAQRVVLDGLVGDPGVVVAADLDDALRRLRRCCVVLDCCRHRCPRRKVVYLTIIQEKRRAYNGQF